MDDVFAGEKGGQRPGGQPHSLLAGLSEREEFDVTRLKLVDCPNRHRHSWQDCPFAHPGERARRREPGTYTGIACPLMKQEGRCADGSACPFAHSDWEFWLHPTKYHTAMCKIGPTCQRRFCFFAHDVSELRIPSQSPEEYLAVIAPGTKPPTPASREPQTAAGAQQEQHSMLPSVGAQQFARAGASSGGGGGDGRSAEGQQLLPPQQQQQQLLPSLQQQQQRVSMDPGSASASYLDGREPYVRGPWSQQPPSSSSRRGSLEAGRQSQSSGGEGLQPSGRLALTQSLSGPAQEGAEELVERLRGMRVSSSDQMLAPIAEGMQRAITAPPILDASPTWLSAPSAPGLFARSRSLPTSPLAPPASGLTSSPDSFQFMAEVDTLALARRLAQGRAAFSREGLLPMQPLGWQSQLPPMQPLLPDPPPPANLPPLARISLPTLPPLVPQTQPQVALAGSQAMGSAAQGLAPPAQPLLPAEALLQLVQQVERVRQARQAGGQQGQGPEQPPQ